MPIRPALAATLLLLAAGCTRGGGAAPPPERFLPADAPLTVVVPSVREAQARAAPLARTVLTFPAAARAGEVLAALRDQLGFDPLDPAAVEAAGLDVGRGAAVAFEAGRRAPLLCLPVGDAGRLEDLLARLARDRLGAGRREKASVAGRDVVVFRAREGGPVALAYAVAQRTAVVSPGEDAPARVAAAAGRREAEALAASPAFRRARAALGASAAVLAFVPPGSAGAAPLGLARDGAALGLDASATRLAARVALLLAPERAAYWRRVLEPAAAAGAAGDAGTSPRAAAAPDGPALSRLPPDASLAARFDGDTAEAGRRALPLLAPAVDALRRAGLDAEHDLLPLLAPGAAAALSLAPTFDVAAASHASDVAPQDPFRLVHLAVVLSVKDPAALAAALERARRATPRDGVAVSAATFGAVQGWTVAWGRSQLELALDGRRLLAGGGAGVLAAMLARGSGAAPPYVPPTDTARTALAGGAAGAVLDLVQLVASFRALPPQAYGSGPDAFVMRSLADRLIDPASRLLAASARLELAGEAALLDLVVEARPPDGGAR